MPLRTDMIPEPYTQQVAAFPAPLRELIEAELKAGNHIVAIEHGFPAAPCGASVRLAQAVGEERRRSVGEVRFYARNNNSYAGEFTTAQRHFFVLEPPLPPPPPPDMDAIRRAMEPKPDALSALAQREARTGSVGRDAMEQGRSANEGNGFTIPSARALLVTETDVGATRVLHFRDQRPPHEIQFALERDLMTLFTANMRGEKLVLTASATVVGARYDFELCFEAALPHIQCYTLRVATSWAGAAATHHDYFRRTAGSWFGLWTRGFTPSDPLEDEAGSPELYQSVCTASLKAEAHIDTVAALQRAIVSAVKNGARFTTAHKEGGTIIRWNGSHFERTDHGDYPDHLTYATEVEFLEALRNFYDWETSKNMYPEKATDLVAWKLILRLMRT